MTPIKFLYLATCVWLFFAPVRADIMNDIRELSSSELEGRKTGSSGAEQARTFITDRFKQIGLIPLAPDFEHGFRYGAFDKIGINLVAYKQGCRYPDKHIVLTAHYDHLGRQGRLIFHGADDNASGVAAMLAVAEWLKHKCPSYSYIFVATDAEENGLFGSKAFVVDPPVAKDSLVLNLNLDMVSRADKRGRLYLTGAKIFPDLVKLLKISYPKLQFLPHSGPSNMKRGSARYYWPDVSDHGPFYRADIPYLFFGGQEHPQYHTEDDQWQRIEPEFLQMALSAILYTVEWIDSQLPHQL